MHLLNSGLGDSGEDFIMKEKGAEKGEEKSSVKKRMASKLAGGDPADSGGITAIVDPHLLDCPFCFEPFSGAIYEFGKCAGMLQSVTQVAGSSFIRQQKGVLEPGSQHIDLSLIKNQKHKICTGWWYAIISIWKSKKRRFSSWSFLFVSRVWPRWVPAGGSGEGPADAAIVLLPPAASGERRGRTKQ